jgi:recombination protein RecA
VILTKSGGWYSYYDEQLGQGRENARQFLKEHDDVAREIEKRAKEELGIVEKATDDPEDVEADEAAADEAAADTGDGTDDS